MLTSAVEKKSHEANSTALLCSEINLSQTCHFDLTGNLNEYEKKYEYTEKNLNLTTNIALL